MYVAKSGADTGINSFGLLFYNSMLAIPFVFACSLIMGELEGVMRYPFLFELKFLVFSHVFCYLLLTAVVFFCQLGTGISPELFDVPVYYS